MQQQVKLSTSVQEILRCPICKDTVELLNGQFKCLGCHTHFPTVNGIPVLLNETSSIFTIDDFVHQRETFFDLLSSKRKIKKTLIKLLPRISTNIKARENYNRVAGLLLQRENSPKVLVLGGSVIGQGIQDILSNPSIEFIESDVSFGTRIGVIIDCHDIPFEDNSLDCVIAQAVLEHVVNPFRCVGEIHRVLKEGGLVYAETPFMQQVHGGKYDFTRFTHLGHRRLFREFEEIDSGATCGPGMALAWSYQYFLLSFFKSKILSSLVKVFVRLTCFWLKYFDHYLINKPGSFDAASGYYFLGRKSEEVLPDKELLQLYRGMQK